MLTNLCYKIRFLWLQLPQRYLSKEIFVLCCYHIPFLCHLYTISKPDWNLSLGFIIQEAFYLTKVCPTMPYITFSFRCRIPYYNHFPTNTLQLFCPLIQGNRLTTSGIIDLNTVSWLSVHKAKSLAKIAFATKVESRLVSPSLLIVICPPSKKALQNIDIAAV